jgi:hypothetical protein
MIAPDDLGGLILIRLILIPAAVQRCRHISVVVMGSFLLDLSICEGMYRKSLGLERFSTSRLFGEPDWRYLK